MNLLEALRRSKRPAPEGGPRLRIALACGITPLHFPTFLAAHLHAADAQLGVEVLTGLFGDCLGNLQRLATGAAATRSPGGSVSPAPGPRGGAGCLLLEWCDLDPRLGTRQLGGWRPADLADILPAVAARTGSFLEACRRREDLTPLVVALPSLPLPPAAYTPLAEAGRFELELHASVRSFAAQLAALPHVRVVSTQELDLLSPAAGRFDAKSEWHAGFPYTLAHTDALASLCARLLRPRVPKKGLITDLDDTLWDGLLGEVGVAGLSWHLDRGTQRHGVYQQLLSALAESGVLLAVASKNDPARVQEVFTRGELLLRAAQVFPFEVHWGSKAESVRRILAAWNVGPDSVVFVDDSPAELAEVQQAHPAVECLAFPASSDAGVYELLRTLRDRFGKHALSQDDALRLESLRQGAQLKEDLAAGGDQTEAFLAQMDAELVHDFRKDPSDARALELLNKTNQFNLNGKRIGAAEWQAFLARPETFLQVASYKDKYGPLGKIAVLAGRVDSGEAVVEHWVMSCRAFSRRIEHACLKGLFEHCAVRAVKLDFQATDRNGPLQEFLRSLGLEGAAGGVRLSREDFLSRCPKLFQRVRVT